MDRKINSDRIHKADVSLFGYALSTINDLPKEETVIIEIQNLTSLRASSSWGIKTMAVTWGFGDLEDLLLYLTRFYLSLHLIFFETLKIGLQIVNLFFNNPKLINLELYALYAA